MKDEFNRTDGLFSLCGLNCGLCPMQIRGECSGCFNGSTCYLTCPLAPCSVRHGNVQYCFQCPEYPCKRYDGIDAHDSLISHRNQKRDMLKAKEMGIETYLAEQSAKKALLTRMLEEYDDGHHDVFFCLAANLLDVDDLESVIRQADENCVRMNQIEKANWMVCHLQNCADKRQTPLILRR